MKVRSAEHFATCARSGELPATALPEVAFLGRSNVGKSSLLNRLAQRKNLARTSGTPGKTRLIQFFRVAVASRELLLVDLPGYGYAKVARSEREQWRRLVEGYLEGREALRAAILLQDVRRDSSEDETLLLDWLAERGVPCLVALTKIDKQKPMRRAARIRELRRQLDLPAGRVIATSARSGEGLDPLWRAILAQLP